MRRSAAFTLITVSVLSLGLLSLNQLDVLPLHAQDSEPGTASFDVRMPVAVVVDEPAATALHRAWRSGYDAGRSQREPEAIFRWASEGQSYRIWFANRLDDRTYTDVTGIGSVSTADGVIHFWTVPGDLGLAIPARQTLFVEAYP